MDWTMTTTRQEEKHLSLGIWCALYRDLKVILITDALKQFLPEASFGLQVLSLPASVCLCVSVCVCVRQPRACPHHKSSRVQAWTTKFWQKVQNNLVKIPIVLGAIDLDLQGQI